MQILDLHCIFMVLYKTISIFPLASLVVLYIYTQKYKYTYTYKYRFKSGCKCNEKNENLQYYIIEKIRRQFNISMFSPILVKTRINNNGIMDKIQAVFSHLLLDNIEK